MEEAILGLPLGTVRKVSVNAKGHPFPPVGQEEVGERVTPATQSRNKSYKGQGCWGPRLWKKPRFYGTTFQSTNGL